MILYTGKDVAFLGQSEDYAEPRCAASMLNVLRTSANAYGYVVGQIPTTRVHAQAEPLR